MTSHPRPSAQSKSVSALVVATIFTAFALSAGCAQRAHLSEQHAMSYKKIFSAQAIAPDAKLAALDSEDSKGLMKRREKRKSAEATAGARSSSAASRAARQFSLGGR